MTFNASLPESQSSSLKRKFESLSAVTKIKEQIEATVQQLAEAQLNVERIKAEAAALGEELKSLNKHYDAMETAHEDISSKWKIEEHMIQRPRFADKKTYLDAKLALAEKKILIERGHIQLLNLGITMETKEKEIHATENRLKIAKQRVSDLQLDILKAVMEFERAGLELCGGAAEFQEPKRNKLDLKSMTVK